MGSSARGTPSNADNGSFGGKADSSFSNLVSTEPHRMMPIIVPMKPGGDAVFVCFCLTERGLFWWFLVLVNRLIEIKQTSKNSQNVCGLFLARDIWKRAYRYLSSLDQD